jgi:hypothetical protein
LLLDLLKRRSEDFKLSIKKSGGFGTRGRMAASEAAVSKVAGGMAPAWQMQLSSALVDQGVVHYLTLSVPLY